MDDDRDLVRGLELYLRLEGFEVSCAFGGMGALEEMRVNNPSAIILDILMPDINGADVCRHIRDKLGDSTTAVIVLSALSDDKARQDLMAAGANAYLTKPCDFKRITKAVNQYTS